MHCTANIYIYTQITAQIQTSYWPIYIIIQIYKKDTSLYDYIYSHVYIWNKLQFKKYCQKNIDNKEMSCITLYDF